ncbi:hypothetical protein Rleg9DRAFT_6537 [Rhizobium leguminosarum bv. trifolii WSM597]|uniref:Uncharacterized protein n=1 Tax=Rhizobium leguminosarum bv. trifolii WSM597 TaxID=754764 RepID=J0HAX9_RHILT|nr:hypothetical protein [Rhizobium leguminosarum]EJB07523.1 hypothetical protein Rleg9DRAFT_6537 [Rhizobium leguminosarum bv. trifolii WSM597]
MSNVPAWIQVLQALLTPAIAIAVGVIGFLQWRTAHQKVVLDLFERRAKLFEDTIEAVESYFSRYDEHVGSETILRLYRTQTKAQFLFGPEIVDLLETIRGDVIRHDMLSRRYDRLRLDPDQLQEYAALATRINSNVDKLAPACVPYMKMDQRQLRTTSEWFAERNGIRLSYADDKQR